MTELVHVDHGRYHDSVTLMRASATGSVRRTHPLADALVSHSGVMRAGRRMLPLSEAVG